MSQKPEHQDEEMMNFLISISNPFHLRPREILMITLYKPKNHQKDQSHFKIQKLSSWECHQQQSNQPTFLTGFAGKEECLKNETKNDGAFLNDCSKVMDLNGSNESQNEASSNAKNDTSEKKHKVDHAIVSNIDVAAENKESSNNKTKNVMLSRRIPLKRRI